MHKIYTSLSISSYRGEIDDVAYAGLSFDMAKERAYRGSDKIKVWLEGVHIETYQKQKVEGKDEREWVKTYDRKDKLAEQIKSANMELDALTAAHILLQEEEKKCSTSLGKTVK